MLDQKRNNGVPQVVMVTFMTQFVVSTKPNPSSESHNGYKCAPRRIPALISSCHAAVCLAKVSGTNIPDLPLTGCFLHLQQCMGLIDWVEYIIPTAR